MKQGHYWKTLRTNCSSNGNKKTNPVDSSFYIPGFRSRSFHTNSRSFLLDFSSFQMERAERSVCTATFCELWPLIINSKPAVVNTAVTNRPPAPLRLVFISPGAIIFTPGILLSSRTISLAVSVSVVCSRPRGLGMRSA